MDTPTFIYLIYMSLTMGFFTGLMYSFFFDWIRIGF